MGEKDRLNEIRVCIQGAYAGKVSTLDPWFRDLIYLEGLLTAERQKILALIEAVREERTAQNEFNALPSRQIKTASDLARLRAARLATDAALEARNG